MATSILLTVTDTKGDEVAALLDGTDLSMIRSGPITARHLVQDLQRCCRAATPGRQVSIGVAMMDVKALPPRVALNVQRARVTEGSMPTRT